MIRFISGFLSVGLVLVVASSCTPVSQLQYMQGAFDTARISQLNYPENRIQKGDLLGISVFSDDPVATAAVVASSTATVKTDVNAFATTPTVTNGGYFTVMVDDLGRIQVYRLGVLPVEGMTRRAVAELLAREYAQKQLLVNPLTDVKMLNYKVTVMGEVARPGPVHVPADRISVMEAIGLAGDITVFGRRDNVMVIREIDGKRVFGRMNLRDPNVYQSPYFYLRQNDLVIVDVDKAKTAQTDQTTFQIIAISTSILSTIAFFLNILK